MSLRWSLRRVRRRLRPYRLWLAAFAGAFATVLSTIYENLSPIVQFGALVTLGVVAGIAVLLSDSRYVLPAEIQAVPLVAGGSRTPADSGEEAGTSSRPRFPGRLGSRSDRVVPALPPSDGLFRGRERELAHLVAWHDRQRQARSTGGRAGRWWSGGWRDRGGPAPVSASRQATGPALLLIHGKPGVGKGAVAEELARRLADRYPDGQIVANLGTAGEARPPLDVLKDFLLALGWPEREMPDSVVGRAIIVRSLTAKKRILFILDAARHADQLRQVLPSDPAAAVIVTSRPDLTVDPELSTWSYPGERSYLLEAPDDDEAMDIFRAMSETDDAERPKCAAEIVAMSGNLPAAIRSAAERVSHDGTDICQVADLLRRQRSRLATLERPGRPVASLIEAEYVRLLPDEQRAFAMLALVPAPTFVPWVLAPLMDVDHAQAEALMDRLSAAQLLDNLGADEPTGLARYGFHPLIRLFARQQAEGISPPDRVAMQERLTEAYRELLAVVVGAPGAVAGRGWSPTGRPQPARITAQLDRWVRAEYLNLLPVIDSTIRHGDVALCWRIGTLLGGCVPDGVDLGGSLTAYAQALDAAGKDDAPFGRIDVLLSRATLLAAAERHPDTEACLEEAAREARALRGQTTGDPAVLREAVANRQIGEAFLQNQSYRHASEALHEALDLAEATGDGPEQQLIQLLLDETYQVKSDEATYEQTIDPRVRERNRYRVILVLAETARRRGDLRNAHDHLEQALRLGRGDLHRTATALNLLARLHLNAPAADAEGPIPPAAGRAIRYAARAAVTFAEIHNDAGVLRANCLLARALLGAGRPVEAAQVAHAAQRDLDAMADLAEEFRAPLAAQVKRTRGELLLHSGHLAKAEVLLMEAATTFAEHHDWAAQREMVSLLEQARRPAPSSATARGPKPAIPVAASAAGRVPEQRAGDGARTRPDRS